MSYAKNIVTPTKLVMVAETGANFARNTDNVISERFHYLFTIK